MKTLLKISFAIIAFSTLIGCDRVSSLCERLPGGICERVTAIFSKDETADVKKAYEDYKKAFLAEDLESVKKAVTKERLNDMEAENAQEMLALAVALSPKDAKILKIEVKGNDAVMTLSGKSEMGKMSGTTLLKKEDNAWKVHKESWEIKIGFNAEEEELPPNMARPEPFTELLGAWEGKEISADSEWSFSFSDGYNVSIKGPEGDYAAKASIHWDLGVGADGNFHVPPGWGMLDMDILEGRYSGKTSLGAYAIQCSECCRENGLCPEGSTTTMKFCAGEPGTNKRVTSYKEPGFRCFELTQTAKAAPAAPQSGNYSEETSASSEDQPSGATGEASIIIDGVSEKYELKTDFFSDTRFDDPEKATIEFQMPGPKTANMRRIIITLDSTATGDHIADGPAIASEMFEDRPVAVGQSGPRGRMAILKFIANGGQVFPPKESCVITITSPYTGNPDSVFSGNVSGCVVTSAGIERDISSIEFSMEGVPSR